MTRSRAGINVMADPHRGGMGKKGHKMEPDVKHDVLKRLNYIEGHLNGIRSMIEGDKYCPEVLKQTYAVRRAIEALERKMLDGHLHHCVVEGIRDGREDQVIAELLELYELANR